MPAKVMRNIVKIDQEKCDGCGQCVPSCHEGAIRIVNGKAQLAAENLCDGLGACLGHCPQGAITVEQRPADEFDEHAVQAHLHAAAPAPANHHAHQCPSARLRTLQPSRPAPATAAHPGTRPSRLGQWPVQLALVPPSGPIWQNADVLIAADCVPFALNDFHENMLAGKTLAIACPKLDDVEPYIQKLAHIFANNPIRSITVAHMEVPCCTGIVRVVQAALAAAGRTDIPMTDITVSIEGRVG